MIEIGSPLIDMLTTAGEEDLRQLPLNFPNTAAGQAWQHFEQIVCDNVTSVRFVRESQNILPDGLVSLKILSLMEIQELYTKIRDLSISPEELENFRKIHQSDQESEQSELDTEGGEDSGEE